jgi:anti-sigma factor RsiW
MSACHRMEMLLHGYRDEELRGWHRWRVERHLAGCPACVRELEQIDRIGGWIRETAPARMGPDLWQQIAARLPAPAAPIAAKPRSSWLGAWLAPARWAPVVAAGAMATFIWILWPGAAPIATAGVVRSIYSNDMPVVVLEGEGDTTIIWLMDDPVEPGEHHKKGGGDEHVRI